MAKQPKTDRQAVIDSIRKQQSGGERRRGIGIIAVASIFAVALVGAVAWQPVSDAMESRKYADVQLADMGASAKSCTEISKKPAEGEQDHVPQGTPMTYDDAPPAFGKHWDIWDTMERKFYTASDRPELGELVHNLEHGYTMLWYDETAAKDKDTVALLRAMADKFGDNENMRDKFKVVPWTKKDGKAFPDGNHIAITHWSAGRGADESGKQEGVFQYCSEPSGAALAELMEKYPYMDSPEPNAV